MNTSVAVWNDEPLLQSHPNVNRVTAVELGRIGVNLNQLVRAMNTAIASGQEIPLVEEALNQVKAVDEAVKKIQSELLRP